MLHNTTDTRLDTLDIGVLSGYFVIIIIVGIYAMWRSNQSTVSGYFLAGRSMWWLPIGASLFVSNIGTEHFIGLAGSGAATGISVGAWEFNALIFLQMLGWIFAPVYIASGICTMPEYLSKRFGGSRLRVYFAILSLVLYVFTKLSINLYTGALFIQQSLKWDLYLCIFVLIAITAVFTITGGLTAVIYTDTIQATLMIGGGLTLMVLAFKEVGGYPGLVEKYMNSSTQYIVENQTCHLPNPRAFKLLRGINDPDMPWLGFILGQTPGSIWYWCADQVIVQRLLAAKSISHAQGATLMSGVLKLLPMFMMVMPGMISRVLYPDEVACVVPERCYEICQSYVGCSNIAFPKLVLGLMPTGLRGLMMAVMVAALMSDLDSIFNSASTLFTIDIWKKIRKTCSVREQMAVGRIFVCVMVGVSVAWVPVVKETQGGQVFIYINEIIGYLGSPFAVVFLLGIFYPRVNEKGCFCGLMVALVTGVTRMTLGFVYPDSAGCGQESHRPAILAKVHFLYFSLIQFIMTTVVVIVVSHLTAPPKPKYLYRTTYWTRFQEAPPDIHLDAPDEPEDSRKGDNERKTFRDTSLDEPDPEARSEQPAIQFQRRGCSSNAKRAVAFMCGTKSEAENPELLAAIREHLRRVAEIKQSPRIKAFLACGMMFIVCLTVFLFIFFSVWEYKP